MIVEVGAASEFNSEGLGDGPVTDSEESDSIDFNL